MAVPRNPYRPQGRNILAQSTNGAKSTCGERIEGWPDKLPVVKCRLEMAETKRLGCYNSQMAAIKALACDGASPYEAKQAARRPFGVAQ